MGVLPGVIPSGPSGGDFAAMEERHGTPCRRKHVSIPQVTGAGLPAQASLSSTQCLSSEQNLSSSPPDIKRNHGSEESISSLTAFSGTLQWWWLGRDSFSPLYLWEEEDMTEERKENTSLCLPASFKGHLWSGSGGRKEGRRKEEEWNRLPTPTSLPHLPAHVFIHHGRQ